MINLIVLLIIIFFALAGLRKGFWQYLLELLITALALWASWLYYQQKHLILSSLLVFVWVFLGLSVLKWFLLRMRRKRTGQQLSLSSTNRSCGAILGFIWGMFIVVLVIFTIDILPTAAVFKYNIKEKIQASAVCRIFQRLIPLRKVAIVENISYMSKVSVDEEAKMRLGSQPEVQELLQHQHLKAIREDEEIVSQLENKELQKLLVNPKILKLLNDGEFVEKLLRLDFKKALEE